AVDRSPEAAHECGHLAADRKLPGGTGLHNADALDTADLGRLGPFSFAHVHFRVIDAERLLLDDDEAGLRFGLRHVLEHETVQGGTEVVYHDSSHVRHLLAFLLGRRMATHG